jgi:CubicO group peptidase (beta-lactamase class C family)
MTDNTTQTVKKIEKLIQEWSGKGIFPGISILVSRKDNILFKRAYGFKSLIPQKEASDPETIYDLASLTKPLITAFLVLYFSQREKISLDAGIKTFFPTFPFDCTITQLLNHTSGLPAWEPIYLKTQPYLDTIASLPLQSKPGSQVNYSCLGYILLHFLLQKVGGGPYSSLAESIIFKPLGLNQTFLEVPSSSIPAVAPTEEGNGFEKKKALGMEHYKYFAQSFNWRDKIIRGETHDGNSYYCKGSAGNAGLFSNSADLFKLSREFFPSSATILKPETVTLFWENTTPFKKSHRTRGFKLNSSLQSSGGQSLSRKAIGHNGFTGTSIWMEPEGETTYIILSNRVHPVVESVNFNKVRRRLHRHLKRLTKD